MRENYERKKVRINKRYQTIKESTSQSLLSIRETGRSYSHKLHKGVRSAMENVGKQQIDTNRSCLSIVEISKKTTPNYNDIFVYNIVFYNSIRNINNFLFWFSLFLFAWCCIIMRHMCVV